MPFWTPIGSDVLGNIHIANNAGGFEPQRGHDFDLLVEVPGEDAEILLKSVETGFPVSHNSEPLGISYVNETVYIAGRPLFAPAAVVYRDFVNQETYAMLERWSQKVYDPLTSEIGFAEDYKSQATLTMFDVKGGNRRSWFIIGIWPQDISQEAPSMVSGDIMRLNVTFQYDKAWPQFAY